MNEFNAVSTEELNQVDGGSSVVDELGKRLADEVRKTLFPTLRDLVLHLK